MTHAGCGCARARPGVLVTVADVRGHAPREAGAKMVVAADVTWGSIGGGNLEAVAIDRAARCSPTGGTEPESSTSRCRTRRRTSTACSAAAAR